MVLASRAKWEIRVRFGRDDKVVKQRTSVSLGRKSGGCHDFVVSTGAQRSGETCGFFPGLTTMSNSARARIATIQIKWGAPFWSAPFLQDSNLRLRLAFRITHAGRER